MKHTPALLIIGLMSVLPSHSIADAEPTPSTEVVVTEHTATDESTYYSIAISLPAGISSVAYAWLEFRADISAKEVNGFVDPVPILEVYALKQPLSGDPDESEFETTIVPMSRPTAAGVNRLVRIDITEHVQRILASPSKNHGFVLGPLTADKRGIFEIKKDGLGPGVTARVQIVEKPE